MKKITVAVLDDHKLFRDGLVELIGGFPGYVVIIEADNGQDFLRQVGPERLPDIVLLDINMKLMDGYETGAMVAGELPGG